MKRRILTAAVLITASTVHAHVISDDIGIAMPETERQMALWASDPSAADAYVRLSLDQVEPNFAGLTPQKSEVVFNAHQFGDAIHKGLKGGRFTAGSH